MSIVKLRDGTFCFRGFVPKDLIGVNSPKEIYVRLDTCDLNQAISLSKNIKSFLTKHFIFLRQHRLSFYRKRLSLTTGDIMFDLIASLTINNTEITIKATTDNQSSFSTMVGKVLSLDEKRQAMTSVLPSFQKFSESRKNKLTAGYQVIVNNLNKYILKALEDVYFEQIDRKFAINLKNKILELPLYKSHADFYTKNLPIEKLPPNYVRIRRSTASGIFTLLSAFFTWCYNEGIIETNHFKGLDRDREPVRSLETYTIEDLRALFVGEEFRQFCGKWSSRYWISVLALYSGARLAEITSLEVKDVSQSNDGNYYLSINKISCVDGVYRSVKNKHSIRIIPIAQKVIDLGFEKYLETIKKEGYLVLFPDLGLDTKNAINSVSFSSAFTRHKNRVCENSGNKTFHCLRHNFVSRLQQLSAPLPKIQQIIGHAFGTITFDVYGEPFDPNGLKETVDMIDYDLDIMPWFDTFYQKRQRQIGWQKILSIKRH